MQITLLFRIFFCSSLPLIQYIGQRCHGASSGCMGFHFAKERTHQVITTEISVSSAAHLPLICREALCIRYRRSLRSKARTSACRAITPAADDTAAQHYRRSTHCNRQRPVPYHGFANASVLHPRPVRSYFPSRIREQRHQ